MCAWEWPPYVVFCLYWSEVVINDFDQEVSSINSIALYLCVLTFIIKKGNSCCKNYISDVKLPGVDEHMGKVYQFIPHWICYKPCDSQFLATIISV